MPADTNALLEIGAAIHSTRDPEIIEKQLIEMVSRALSADRGVILFLGKNGERFAPVCGWDAREGIERGAEHSRAIIDEVLREKTPLIRNEDADGITAALCVPLMVFGRIRGVIYLDSTDLDVSFDAGQLDWLSAVGAIIALVLDNARRIERLESENSRLRAEIAVDRGGSRWIARWWAESL